MKNKINYAIVGATGAVGREMVETLVQRKHNVDNIRLLASERSAGSTIEVGGKEVVVEQLTKDSFEEIDIALFSAGASVSKEFAVYARDANAIVIDNSSCFRMDKDILLIVPQVNKDVLEAKLKDLSKDQGLIIANPNCSTIQLVVALKPISDKVGLERVVVSTYQAVSGAGKKGMDELWNQLIATINQKRLVISKFPHKIAFNCIPHIDVFEDNGYTKEEMKLENETRKILGIPDLKITATAVRVPAMNCHSESVNIETKSHITAEEVKELLSSADGVVVQDDVSNNLYPLATESVGTDDTFVGRIRQDFSIANGINMWVVADNLRKGAALNAVEIAEVVIEQRFK